MEKLETPRDVMQAFLAGKKLINSEYGADGSGEYYLYLSKQGHICEEDGAKAKSMRIPLNMSQGGTWWKILGEYWSLEL